MIVQIVGEPRQIVSNRRSDSVTSRSQQVGDDVNEREQGKRLPSPKPNVGWTT